MKSDKSKGNLSAVISGVFQASVVVFWAYLLSTLARPVLMVYWFSAAFVILIVFLKATKKLKFDFKRLPIIPILIFGSFSFITTFLIMRGVAVIGASLTAFIMQTAVIFSLFYSFFGLKEKFKKSELGGILIIAMGLFILSWRADLAFTISSLLIILAAASPNHFLAKKLLKKVPKLQLNLIRIFFILVFSIVYLILTGTQLEPISLKILSILIIGVVVGPISIYVFYYLALQKTNLAIADALKGIQPIFTFIIAFIFLGEILSLQQTISAILILIGTYFILKK